MNNKLETWLRDHKTLAFAALAIFVTLVVIVSLTTPETKPSSQENKSKPAAKTKYLQLSYSLNETGLEINNKEDKTLRNCTIKLNETFQTKSNLLVGTTTVAFTSFTDEDGMRYDSSIYTPNDVMVHLCEGDKRMSVLTSN